MLRHKVISTYIHVVLENPIATVTARDIEKATALVASQFGREDQQSVADILSHLTREVRIQMNAELDSGKQQALRTFGDKLAELYDTLTTPGTVVANQTGKVVTGLIDLLSKTTPQVVQDTCSALLSNTQFLSRMAYEKPGQAGMVWLFLFSISPFNVVKKALTALGGAAVLTGVDKALGESRFGQTVHKYNGTLKTLLGVAYFGMLCYLNPAQAALEAGIYAGSMALLGVGTVGNFAKGQFLKGFQNLALLYCMLGTNSVTKGAYDTFNEFVKSSTIGKWLAPFSSVGRFSLTALLTYVDTHLKTVSSRIGLVFAQSASVAHRDGHQVGEAYFKKEISHVNNGTTFYVAATITALRMAVSHGAPLLFSDEEAPDSKSSQQRDGDFGDFAQQAPPPEGENPEWNDEDGQWYVDAEDTGFHGEFRRDVAVPFSSEQDALDAVSSTVNQFRNQTATADGQVQALADDLEAYRVAFSAAKAGVRAFQNSSETGRLVFDSDFDDVARNVSDEFRRALNASTDAMQARAALVLNPTDGQVAQGVRAASQTFQGVIQAAINAGSGSSDPQVLAIVDALRALNMSVTNSTNGVVAALPHAQTQIEIQVEAYNTAVQSILTAALQTVQGTVNDAIDYAMSLLQQARQGLDASLLDAVDDQLQVIALQTLPNAQGQLQAIPLTVERALLDRVDGLYARLANALAQEAGIEIPEPFDPTGFDEFVDKAGNHFFLWPGIVVLGHTVYEQLPNLKRFFGLLMRKIVNSCGCGNCGCCQAVATYRKPDSAIDKPHVRLEKAMFAKLPVISWFVCNAFVAPWITEQELMQKFLETFVERQEAVEGGKIVEVEGRQ